MKTKSLRKNSQIFTKLLMLLVLALFTAGASANGCNSIDRPLDGDVYTEGESIHFLASGNQKNNLTWTTTYVHGGNTYSDVPIGAGADFFAALPAGEHDIQAAYESAGVELHVQITVNVAEIVWEDLSFTAEGDSVTALYRDGPYLYASVENQYEPGNSGVFRANLGSKGIGWTGITPEFELNDPAGDEHDYSVTSFLRAGDDFYAAFQWIGLFTMSETRGVGWTGILFPSAPSEGITRIIADPHNAGRLVACTRNGGFTATKANKGVGWTGIIAEGPGTGGAHCADMAFDPGIPDVIYGGSGRMGEFRISADGGENWTSKPGLPTDGHVVTIEAQMDRVLIFMSNGDLYETLDSGISFDQLHDSDNPSFGDICDAYVTDDVVIYGGSDLFISTNGGDTFSTYTLPAGMSGLRSAYLFDGMVYLAGDGIYRTKPWW